MRKAYIMDGTKPNTGILDFSYLLDAPAGKHGFLQEQEGKLVFEDGTPVKLFGVNMLREGCLPDHDAAAVTAGRLASAGLNIVRMHFMDGQVDVCDFGEGATLIDYSKGNTRTLDPESLDRLDFFVAELKKRGIYTQLDTLVGRNYDPVGDELEFPEEFPRNWSVKQINIYNRRLVELHKEYARQLLTHLNPYTGLRYVDDPCIAVVQIMNENGLLWDMGMENGMLTSPYNYSRQFDALWTNWLRNKYKSHEALKKAWTNHLGECALDRGEHLRVGIRRPTDSYNSLRHVGTEHNHPYRSINGPARTADYIEFLMAVEIAFIKEMNACLREIGVKCCINTTNMVRGAASAYTSGMFCDIQENDHYYNHPTYGYDPPARQLRIPMVENDPRSMYSGPPADENIITRLATAKVKGKPFMVAEWNVPFPTTFSSDAMIMMSSYSALQDWDGVCTFQYINKQGVADLKIDQLTNYFTIFNDPAKWGQIGICSAVFQQKLIQPAKNTVLINYTADDLKSNPPATYDFPYRVLPYFTKTEVSFLEKVKSSDGDVVIAAGFTPSGDYIDAKHAVVFSESPYIDHFQHQKDEGEYLIRHAEEDARALNENVSIGPRRALIHDAAKLYEDDYAYGNTMAAAMKQWGLLGENEGIINNNEAFRSDTGEILYAFSQGYFAVSGEQFAAYSGSIQGAVSFGHCVFDLRNERMTISMLARDGLPLDESKHILITAVGENCNTGMQWEEDFLVDMGHAPCWVDQAEGTVLVENTAAANLWALLPDGTRGEQLKGKSQHNGLVFDLDTRAATVHFELLLN